MSSIPKPFRFGVNLADIPPQRSLAEEARILEDLGYAVLSCPDHLHYPATPLEPMTALATAAGATSTLELQPLVLANGFRHPTRRGPAAALPDCAPDGFISILAA